jgi:hypothetical protein
MTMPARLLKTSSVYRWYMRSKEIQARIYFLVYEKRPLPKLMLLDNGLLFI